KTFLLCAGNCAKRERGEPRAVYNALSSLATTSVPRATYFQNMNLAALLIPPSLDAKQALRLRRFGLAALSYALAAALVAVAWTFGELPASVVLEVAAAFLAFSLGLYLVIRSGFNLRFDDPSLTRFQILAAITVLMYIVYHMDDGRSVALFGCFFVFLFGIFRLNAREFTVVTLYALAAYALVIVLLMHLRPQAIHDVPREWMSWVMFAGWLPLFTVIGGQINTLRRRARRPASAAGKYLICRRTRRAGRRTGRYSRRTCRSAISSSRASVWMAPSGISRSAAIRCSISPARSRATAAP